MKCHYQNVKVTAKVYKPYLSFFITLSLISLSCSFLHLSISSLASLTSLHTLLAIFTDSKISLDCHTHSLSIIFYCSNSPYTRCTKCSQNLNGLSIIFYRSHSLYMQHMYEIFTDYLLVRGSLRLARNWLYSLPCH